MSTPKLGVEKLTKALMLVFELGNIADAIGRAKGLMRWMPLMGLADELSAMEGVKFADIKAEFLDLDAAERAQLNDAIKAKFDIGNDVLEAKIEDGIAILNDSINIFIRAKSLIKAA